MDFCPENYGDISRYYKGCYVKFPERGDLLHLIHRVDQYSVEGDNERGERFKIELRKDDPYHMEFVLPKKSLFKYKSSILILQRIPARQFKRGINNENTNIIDVESHKTVDLSFDVLKAYVSKQPTVFLKDQNLNLSSCGGR